MLKIEFSSLITTNYQLSLEGIARIEKEDLSQIEDHDERSYQQRYFDDLRVAANNFAVVAVVTRLDHWVTLFCKKLNLKPNKKRKKNHSS